MIVNIISLKAFYGSTVGLKTSRLIFGSLEKIWASVPNERLLGLGFTFPYLDGFKGNTERTFAFMPAKHGAAVWPDRNQVATALVDERCLPLPDASIDRILIVHMLEFAENAEDLLQELWRVLVPNGRLVIVVPNRRGLWARFENTPFGHGEPYSRMQLQRLLRNTNFSLNAINQCLYSSPSPQRFPRFVSRFCSAFIQRLFPYFGGVLVVEAQKKLFQSIPVSRERARRIFVPVLAPQATARSSNVIPHQAADIDAEG